MPRDTRAVLGASAGECESRSLLLERFADPEADKEPRRQFFLQAIGKKSFPIRAEAWMRFLRQGLCLAEADLLYARLQARLMINMAGGAMENAGLLLDRFGKPWIPGTAVKGCARRMAIQQLLEAPDAKAKADLLETLALVFGWVDEDWNLKERDESETDLAYACRSDAESAGRSAPPAWHGAAGRLLDRLKVEKRPHPEEPWKDLPSFAGAVQFLSAYPIFSPSPDLELDVLTGHHPKYYAGNDKPVALDDEDPIPVVFPAVASEHVFVFSVLRTRRADAGGKLLKQAREWLKGGLETFGLGAKTAAGYGWFDASEALQKEIGEQVRRQADKGRVERERAEAEKQRKAEAELRMARAAEEKVRLATMSPEQQEDFRLAQLTDVQFQTALQKFKNQEAGEQAAIVRALRGPRAAAWETLKKRGGKGLWAAVEQAVRQISNQLKLGKMP